MLLVVVDAYSKYPEVSITGSTSSKATSDSLRVAFASHSLPKVIISDNATCFANGNILEVQLRDGRTFRCHIDHIRRRVTDSNDYVALPSKSTDSVVVQPREIASESLVADEAEGSVPATEISPISEESVADVSKPQSLASAPMKHRSDLLTFPAIASSLPRRSQRKRKFLTRLKDYV
ncbi:hypothetical protein SK128_017581 [Halocaridina rubra]|uniref:Integrase catalytic domain-containing protein n=1 Tax=Halocaridina rubra TaxID=373956 RepID=A0AAN8X7X7_HALRR